MYLSGVHERPASVSSAGNQATFVASEGWPR
jgi:hypothetical protein